MAHEHVAKIAQHTKTLIDTPRLRAAEVRAAHADGMSYPRLSREVYAELARLGVPAEDITGAGVGPDNLRKMA